MISARGGREGQTEHRLSRNDDQAQHDKTLANYGLPRHAPEAGAARLRGYVSQKPDSVFSPTTVGV